MGGLRLLISQPLQVLGIASVLTAGMALGAQNEEPPQPKSPAKTAPKVEPGTAVDDAAPQETPAKGESDAGNAPVRGADRPQPRSPAGNQATAEEQRAAVLGAKFDVQADNKGLSVTTIEQNGIWARSGLRQNDKIISIDGQTIANPRQLEAFLWSQPGRQIPVIIERGGQRYTIQVAMPQQNANSGWFGVNLDEGDADVKSDANVKGARVTQVFPSGPASRAGIQQGDILIQINQQPIEGPADAVMLIRELQPQAKVEVVVLRDKEELKIPVVIGSRASSGYQSFYRGQQGQQGQPWNQNDPQFQAGNDNRNNQFQGVPPHAMHLEHQRRMAEQNERIESELQQLRDEVRKLRELLEKK